MVRPRESYTSVTSALLPLAVSRANVVWARPLYWKLWAVLPPMLRQRHGWMRNAAVEIIRTPTRSAVSIATGEKLVPSNRIPHPTQRFRIEPGGASRLDAQPRHGKIAAAYADTTYAGTITDPEFCIFPPFVR